MSLNDQSEGYETNIGVEMKHNGSSLSPSIRKIKHLVTQKPIELVKSFKSGELKLTVAYCYLFQEISKRVLMTLCLLPMLTSERLNGHDSQSIRKLPLRILSFHLCI